MRTVKLLFTVTLISLFFFSCGEKGNKLTQSIPANAVYVTRIDTKTLAEKSEYDIFQNITVSRGLNLAKAFVGEKEAVDMLDAFTKDINALGLDLKGECYIFSDYSYFGILIGVNDAEKVKKAFTSFPITDDEDITFENNIYSFSPERTFSVCWDKDKLIILGNMNSRYYYDDDKEDVDITVEAKKYLTQKEEESINSNSAFTEFLSKKSDISAYYSYANMDILGKMSGASLSEEMKKELEDMKGVNLFAYGSFEKGEITLETQIYYSDSDSEKKFKELSAQTLGKINGDLLKYTPEDPLFLLTANMKGEGIYNYLESLDLISMMEKNSALPDSIITYKELFSQFNGDITFSVNDILKVKKSYTYGSGETYEYEKQEPAMAFFGEVKDGKVLMEKFASLLQLQSEELEKIDENTFSFDDNGVNVYFGVNNNMLFVTNDQATFDRIKSGGTKNSYADLSNGNATVIYGKFDKIRKLAEEELKDDNSREAVVVKEGLSQLDLYQYTASDNFSGKGKIVIKDKDKNSFAVICQFVDKIIALQNDRLGF